MGNTLGDKEEVVPPAVCLPPSHLFTSPFISSSFLLDLCVRALTPLLYAVRIGTRSAGVENASLIMEPTVDIPGRSQKWSDASGEETGSVNTCNAHVICSSRNCAAHTSVQRPHAPQEQPIPLQVLGGEEEHQKAPTEQEDDGLVASTYPVRAQRNFGAHGNILDVGSPKFEEKVLEGEETLSPPPVCTFPSLFPSSPIYWTHSVSVSFVFVTPYILLARILGNADFRAQYHALPGVAKWPILHGLGQLFMKIPNLQEVKLYLEALRRFCANGPRARCEDGSLWARVTTGILESPHGRVL